MGKVSRTPLVLLFVLKCASACDGRAYENFQAVFADMHDGDKKHIHISGSKMTISPSGNDESWVVEADWDAQGCKASVSFNVPGKPNPPPVSLTATLWISTSTKGEMKTEFEFTDPSGTLPSGPLNRWVQIDSKPLQNKPSCPTSLKATYADMHDEDKKEVTIEGRTMTIKPSDRQESWVVFALIDAASCSALIDFNVPGKPNPPPVKLSAALWQSTLASTREIKTEFEFTDPSGTLAANDFPLNHWVEVRRETMNGLARVGRHRADKRDAKNLRAKSV